MKKQNVKTLQLNKIPISSFVKGGLTETPTVDIAVCNNSVSHCPTVGCPSKDCGESGSTYVSEAYTHCKCQ